MPSVSSKQEKFMRAIAHDKDFAAKAEVSQAVGKEFNNADQAKKKSKSDRMYKK